VAFIIRYKWVKRQRL